MLCALYHGAHRMEMVIGAVVICLREGLRDLIRAEAHPRINILNMIEVDSIILSNKLEVCLLSEFPPFRGLFLTRKCFFPAFGVFVTAVSSCVGEGIR